MRTAFIVLLALVLPSAPALRAQDSIRTGDITVRGLTPADFPRMTKLATNVYAYEQIDPSKRTVTAYWSQRGRGRSSTSSGWSPTSAR
jgi:hypothetical protein